MATHSRALITAIVTLVTALAVVDHVPSQDQPSPADREQEVKRLLTELGGSTRVARTNAEKRLLELGPSILSLLPPPELLATASLRESVERIRHQLERRQARESTQASKVTLVGRRSLAEWLEEITRQTGNSLDARDLPPEVRDRPLELEFRDSEFWPVLDDLAARGNFYFEPDAVPGGLKLVDKPEAASKATSRVIGYSGSFRLSTPAAEVIAIGDPQGDAGNRPQKRLARLLVTVEAEPRLRPLFLQFASTDINADRGPDRPLAPFSPDASYDLAAGDGTGRTRLQLDYVLPADDLPKAINLQGVLRVTTAAGSAAIKFIDVGQHANGKPVEIDRRRGGVTVTLQRVRRERMAQGANELSVRVAVAYDSGGPAFESHRTWILHNAAFLEAADGSRVVLNGGFETTLQADGAVGMEYRFINLSEPLPRYAFVYVAPTLIVDVPVRFALESVPLRKARRDK
ncbi:MAG: hypothetical protein EXS05_18655 [Planctomycetaceae bacterium]|nr:hypothetical protein [Planctomycetaceae bacterium]